MQHLALPLAVITRQADLGKPEHMSHLMMVTIDYVKSLGLRLQTAVGQDRPCESEHARKYKLEEKASAYLVICHMTGQGQCWQWQTAGITTWCAWEDCWPTLQGSPL
ncbi:hypothetical protein ABBQ38_007868 [Trebouxia sp. C0009 RCD-2024]